ncbi:LuxR family transcriptional regulator [Rhizobium leguminosarum]|uniref:helix-turn-helix transcriptional regulator n=1 Tax=Rhizobium leguminosarum TaxID=384 RepID=UPI001030E1AA|nr:helix-turn-helix transcriptional regulator [Rhizobium leguminosarum]TBG58385.1 LuxR family transcriptional regulator [Rhizobium leguminosarum]
MTKTVVSARCIESKGFARDICSVTFRMRSKQGFVHASRVLLDGWISSSKETSPEQLYGPASEHFPASMVLCLQGSERSTIVRGYSVQVGQNTTVDEIACRWLASRHDEVQKRARPISARELVEADGNHFAFNALLLPQKGGGWSLAAVDIRFVLPSSNLAADLNRVDHAIFQLLYQGFSIKEIAQEVELSYRTIEHRVERLKARLGARTLPQLVALSIADGLSGKGSRF